MCKPCSLCYSLLAYQLLNWPTWRQRGELLAPRDVYLVTIALSHPAAECSLLPRQLIIWASAWVGSTVAAAPRYHIDLLENTAASAAMCSALAKPQRGAYVRLHPRVALGRRSIVLATAAVAYNSRLRYVHVNTHIPVREALLGAQLTAYAHHSAQRPSHLRLIASRTSFRA